MFCAVAPESSAAEQPPAGGGGGGRFNGQGVPGKAVPWVENAAASSEYRIPPAFFAFIMDRESDFQPDLFYPDKNGGTWGLLQINYEEWSGITGGGTFEDPDIKDPMVHTRYGARYFDNRLETVRTMRRSNPTAPYTTQLTELEALMIAHNAGEGNLENYPELPSITRSYLREFRQKFPRYGGGEPAQKRNSEKPPAGDGDPPPAGAGHTGEANPQAARGRYGLGPVKDHVAGAAGLIGTRFDVKTIGGYRADARDEGGHPAGLALDVMTMEDKAKGQKIRDWTQANAKALGIEYIQFDHYIWSIRRDNEGWRKQADRGSPTQNHEDHLHISFTAQAPAGDQPLTAAPPGGQAPPVGDTPPPAEPQSCPADTQQQPAQGDPLTPVNGVASPIKPGQYSLSATFGQTGIWARYHTGLDFGGTGVGTPMYAVADGTVVDVPGASGWAGPNVFAIRLSDGSHVLYAHASARLVPAGQQVKAGQEVGKTGALGNVTGPHLHFEYYPPGTTPGSVYEATDPATWLRKNGIRP
nr:M23 family metallopeptidase [Naumannella cuiyingiana]